MLKALALAKPQSMGAVSSLFSFEYPVASETSLRTCEAILCQSWSYNKDGTPGFGNEFLARLARDMHWRYHIPIIAPEEVAAVLRKKFCLKGVISIGGGPPSHKSTFRGWNTRVIVDRQSRICQEKGWRTVMLLAQFHHVQRSLGCLRSYGLNPLAPAIPDVDRFFDSRLVHPSHHSRMVFMPREKLCQAWFISAGHMV